VMKKNNKKHLMGVDAEHFVTLHRNEDEII